MQRDGKLRSLGREHGRSETFTFVDAYLKKRPATDLELDFGDRFGGNLTLLPGHRGLSSVPLKLENELQISISDGDKTALDADEMRN